MCIILSLILGSHLSMQVHFEEGLSARHRAASESTRVVSKSVRGKSASEKLSEEGLVKFSARVAIQVRIIHG